MDSSLRTDGGTSDGVSDDATGYEIVTVREKSRGERALGIAHDSELPEMRGPEDWGCGDDLMVPAYEEIKETLDLEEYEIGEHVATIWYDFDAWTYDVEFQVSVGPLDHLLDRVRGRLP